MQSLSDIRRTFADFFKNNDHEWVRSSPLVPQNDPTLLFTNAGMVQFKDVFTGKEKRPYQRAVTAQKCLRAGGKHNDLDNVGYTARHHTFFEMLGNFSFGDYFKEQAIEHAWTLVTKHFCLDPSRLLVTVYAEDEEAAKLWRKIAGLSDDRILRISTSDNFWSMGDTGPCGPCSEIFYDHGEGIPGGVPGSADQDGDRFIEIWNLVFMQFEQHADGKRTDLPNPSIDTGMGLERMAAVIQGVHNNYDVDLFKALIATAQDLVGDNNPKNRQSYNVIADHIRASSFLMADGVLPSNEGRGYVLRRIMRRGMRHAHKLGSQDPLMYRLVPTLVSLMGEAYPELVRAQPLIQQILQQEEEKFRQTLERGLKLLQESTSALLPAQPLPADVAFKLYDTFGFPLDLTQDVLRAEGRTVDEKGFQTCMAEQKQKARAAWVGSGDKVNEQLWFDFYQELGATEFLGYTATEAEATVCALVVNEQSVEEAKQGQDVLILTNQTPFYGESGGQMGDHGVLTTEEGAVVVITDTMKKVGSLHVHVAHIQKGQLKTGQAVKLSVDRDRRCQLAANHSATHLLHAVLRQTLGKHVAQKGSLVAPDRLRFDFTHPRPVTVDEMKQVEKAVNQRILDNQPTFTRLMTPDQAVEQEGALALFGERYGDEVRVVSMSDSVELCGGTHVERLGNIGLFKITGESSVSAGIRRIEAITGTAILALLNDTQQTLSGEREQSRKQVVELQKQLTDIKRQSLLEGESDKAELVEIKGYRAMVHHLKGVPAHDLKALVDLYKQTLGSGLVIVTSVVDDKVALVIGVTPDLTDRVDAVKLVKAGAEILGGQGGGGRADLAQAGGSKPENISQLVETFIQFLAD